MHEYINYDLNLNKFFADHDHSVIANPSKLKYRLNRQIYFQPSASPLIHVGDSELGTCFESLHIPTASWIYDGAGSRRLIETNLDLNTYNDLLHANIGRCIDEIYQQHAQVNLMYSGGIDCMVLLSYIMAKGLGTRTQLICFENITQQHPSGLYTNQNKKRKVLELFQQFQNQIRGMIWHSVTVDHVVRAFNHGVLADLKCYATQAILNQYQDTAFIFGHHGNQVLLHKYIFIDEIVRCNPYSRHSIQNSLINDDNYYTASLRQYTIPDMPVALNRRHFLIKPWHAFQGHHGNFLYSPIGSDINFQMTRSLDFSKIPARTIQDATVARDLIVRNVGTDFDDFVDTESIKENDNLELIQLPMDKLDPDKFWIPQELLHHPEGLEYITHEIGQAHSTGYLPINTAVAIKSLQHISHTY